jgi:hypothetical protein
MLSILKGSDMVAYGVFRSAGVEVIFCLVIEHISTRIDKHDLERNLRTHSNVGDEFTESLSTGYEWVQHWGSPRPVSEYSDESDLDELAHRREREPAV